MRVYHFMAPTHGIQNLAFRRLKIATLDDINDPFELLAVGSQDPVERRALRALRREWGKRFGMLCFSRSWQNPVQWSHYADKHRGLCFGFDIPDELVTQVSYSKDRLTPNWTAINSNNLGEAQEEIMRWSSTKFEHWQYEEEVRVFLSLEERSTEENLYFYDFNDKLRLKEIIIGPVSSVTRAEVNRLLSDEDKREITRFKARLAFKSYRVVGQKRRDLWK